MSPRLPLPFVRSKITGGLDTPLCGFGFDAMGAAVGDIAVADGCKLAVGVGGTMTLIGVDVAAGAEKFMLQAIPTAKNKIAMWKQTTYLTYFNSILMWLQHPTRQGYHNQNFALSNMTCLSAYP